MPTSDEKRVIDKDERRKKIKFFVDIILKLTPAIATIVMGGLAYDFQEKSSAANLLNQREQAETQLRAALFENLIGPLGGSVDGKELDADHQRLLVELLMLNFHEHIEFKPLLIHADKRLAEEIKDTNESYEARSSLRSVARRVRERQVTVLLKEQESSYAIDGNCSAHDLYCDFSESNSSYADEAKVWEVTSPDERYSIKVRIKDMDWENQQFEITVKITDNFNLESRALSFNVTSYDLPFTDNMIIARNQRFALGVVNIDMAKESGIPENIVTLQAVWFPKGYILPHERPVNYQEIRKLLNLEEEEEKVIQ